MRPWVQMLVLPLKKRKICPSLKTALHTAEVSAFSVQGVHRTLGEEDCKNWLSLKTVRKN
jgi:hypothetical protein